MCDGWRVWSMWGVQCLNEVEIVVFGVEYVVCGVWRVC